MIIAKEKKKTNIAEYILYMWQVEDLIRAYEFDIEKIEKNVISQFKQPQKIKTEIKEWYKNLIKIMKQTNIYEKGHLQFVKDIINDLNKLHLSLIKSPDEIKYIEQYNWALPNIRELQTKSKGSVSNDIETCFIGLYALFLLRLQKKEISIETKEAMCTFSNLLSLLSVKYKKNEIRTKDI